MDKFDTFYPLNVLISNLMPVTGLKNVGGVGGARHFENIQLGEHLATN